MELKERKTKIYHAEAGEGCKQGHSNKLVAFFCFLVIKFGQTDLVSSDQPNMTELSFIIVAPF